MKTRVNLFVMLVVFCFMVVLPLSTMRATAQGPSVSPSNPTISVGQTQQFSVPGVSNAASFDAGAFFTCAVLQDGTIRCWGPNESGQLGDGTRNTSSIPVSVVGVSGAMAVSGGGYHTCARLSDGTIQCWGRNNAGQLGPSGIGESSTTAVTVPGISNNTSLSAGAFHNCVRLPDGSLQCWGQNDFGQLGNGSLLNSATPVTVSGVSGTAAVSAGGWHTCALMPNGTVRCWGQNTYGQLGDGTFISSVMPVTVSGISTAVALDAGIFTTCARLQNGTLQCWGRNDSGQLGNGTTTNSSTPTTVPGVTPIAFTPGAEHGCAVMADGSVRCWGDNNWGQLGNNSPPGTISTLPTSPVTGITTATAALGGAEHTCALIQGGALQCWGRNTDGRLGNGTFTDAFTPVSVSGIGVSWSSSNTVVATINASGIATAQNPGTTTITATYSGGSSSTTLTVVSRPTLSVVPAGSGSGTVTSNPAGINCGATCSASYDSGTVVALTASPAGGSTFAGWSGGGCSGTGGCNVTLNASTSVTATFTTQTPQTFPLTVNKSGTGSGTVTSNPGGINCGPTCTASYNSGTVVTLTATPAAGSVFAGWSGGCSGTGPCTVTMDQARTVTAIFTQQTFPLTVTKSGTGSGTVTSNPGGINCGATCTASYNSGTVVTLTATPAAGSVFAGWSGGCSGTGPCTVTMDAARTVTAIFTSQTFPLTVNKSGTGLGTVTSNPAGINCGLTCTASFNSGTLVTLTATPAPGSVFVGWSGGCSGTGPCTVTMDQARTVTAIFNLQLVTLTVNNQGLLGAGKVTSSPSGINCGSTCTANYNHGTTVTLTASPNLLGVTFEGWNGGGCSGTAPCTLTLTANTTVNAWFLLH